MLCGLAGIAGIKQIGLRERPLGRAVSDQVRFRQEERQQGHRRLDEQRVDCSVLVPVLNEESHILASVTAMRRQRFEGRIEFLLVDGGSVDRTCEILSALARAEPRIRLLKNPLGAIPSGLNVALGHARGRWVVRMDAHTQYPDDYVRRGVERLTRAGTRWVSGPAIPAGRGRVSRASALALRTPLGRGGSRKWAVEGGSAADEFELDAGVFGGVWERDTLLEYGGWDERWKRNEDSELAGRFLASGERLVCLPEMAATYSPRDSLRSLWRQYLENGEYRHKTAIKHPRTMRRSNLLAPALVLTVPGSVAGPRILRRGARAGLLAYAAALAAAGAVALRDAKQAPDAMLVPVVLAVMHIGYGAGILKGAAGQAASIAARARGSADHLLAPSGQVFAPSLHDARPAGPSGPTADMTG